MAHREWARPVAATPAGALGTTATCVVFRQSTFGWLSHEAVTQTIEATVQKALIPFILDLFRKCPPTEETSPNGERHPTIRYAPRMRSGIRIGCAVVLVATAACSGSGDDDDDDAATTATPSPTDAPSKTFALNGSGFQVAHVGETAPITAGGTFSVSSVPTAVLTTGSDYTIELFANVNGDSLYQTNTENPGNPDHIYSIPLAAVNDDVDIDFPHGIQATSITWPRNEACP